MKWYGLIEKDIDSIMEDLETGNDYNYVYKDCDLESFLISEL